MKVLFVTSAYPAHPDDPRGVFVHRLARALVRAGLDVGVLAPGAFRAPSHERVDGVEVWRATYWIARGQQLTVGLSGIVPNLRAHPWLVLQVPALVSALAARAGRLAPLFDLVHAHWVYPAGLASVRAARRHRLPFVLTGHGGDLNLARKSRFLRALAARVSRAADACIGVSEALRDQFLSLGVSTESAVCIPLGVETSESDEDVATDAGPPGRFSGFDGLRVVYVGSLIPRKSVSTLIEAQAELEARGRAVICAVVGSGPELRALHNLAERRGVRNVIFAGVTPPRAVVRWIDAADVLVLPSRSEGRPTVVLEAMARGRPVIASAIAGTRELVQDGATGLLFPVGEAHALADRIARLHEDAGLRRQMGAQARRRIHADGLDADTVAQRHAELYRRIVARRRGTFSTSAPR